LKICYISPMTDSEGHAIFTHTLEVAIPLSKIVDEVHLVTLECPNIDPLVTVYRLGKPPLASLTKAYCAIKTFTFLLWFLRKNNIDAIYVRNLATTVVACIAGKLYNLPVIHEVNASPEERSYIKKGIRSLDSFLFPLFYKYSVTNAQHLVAVTSNIKDAIVNNYAIEPSKITVVPNGANTGLFQPMPIDEARTKLQLDRETKYICFVGGLVLWQGLNNLIECTPYILKQCPDTRFLIVGDGPMKDVLIKRAESKSVASNFVFIGAVHYSKVPLYINASDVCVAPFIKARNEKSGISPLKIYEYASCAKPIVTSRLPGLEFIEKVNAGILVKPDNPDDLAYAIVHLLQNDELRAHMAARGRDYVTENHSWTSVAYKIAEICNKVVVEYKKQS